MKEYGDPERRRWQSDDEGDDDEELSTQGGPGLSEAGYIDNGKGWGKTPVTKATSKEDINPKRRRRKSSDKEDNDEGRQQSANEGATTKGGGKDEGKNKKGQNQTTSIADSEEVFLGPST